MCIAGCIDDKVDEDNGNWKMENFAEFIKNRKVIKEMAKIQSFDAKHNI
jgi:hypothetical protein